MYPKTTTLSLAAALVVMVVPASFAQSTSNTALSSSKEEIEGDPQGAIRALGGTGASDTTTGRSVVEVPSLIGGGPARTGGAPMGTRVRGEPQ